jgi:hypothetical protein
MVTEDSRIYVGSIVHLVNRGTSHRVAPGMPRKRSLRMSGLQCGCMTFPMLALDLPVSFLRR